MRHVSSQAGASRGRSRLRKVHCLVVLAAASCLTACGGASPSTDNVSKHAVTSTTSSDVNSSSPPFVKLHASVDACTALTSAEIQQLLGGIPNGVGSEAVGGGGAFKTCRWQTSVTNRRPATASLSLVLNVKDGYLKAIQSTSTAESVSGVGQVAKFIPQSRQLDAQQGKVLVSITASNLPSMTRSQLKSILATDASAVLQRVGA